MRVNVGPAKHLRSLKRFRWRKGTHEYTESEDIQLEEQSLEDSNQMEVHSPVIEIDQQIQKSDRVWQEIIWTLTPFTPVGRALISATQRLQAAGNDTPQLDAQVILAHVLEVDRSWLFAHHDYELDVEQANKYTELIVRRMNHEPVAYLIGKREFYGLDFVVDDRVLIPRPETELLVDAVLDQIETWSYGSAPGQRIRVADVGTGCGSIALSVAHNCHNVEVYATDVSTDAIHVARTNIRRLDQRCQVSLLEGDLLEPLSYKVDMHQVDMIVANLPYIRSTEFNALEPDVRNYEPKLALDAGPEGLDTIKRLIQQAPTYLHPQGMLFLEIGADQGGSAMQLIEEQIPQARMVNLRQDYNGRDRLITIQM